MSDSYYQIYDADENHANFTPSVSYADSSPVERRSPPAGGSYNSSLSILHSALNKAAATRNALPDVTAGTVIYVTSSTDPWYQATEMTTAGTTFTVTSGHTYVRVVEIASNNKPVAVADKPIRFPNK